MKNSWTHEECELFYEANEFYKGSWRRISQHIGTKNPQEVRAFAIRSSITEYRTGRWLEREKSLFMKGLAFFGKDWRSISSLVTTRTPSQIKSHAQKVIDQATKKVPEKADKSTQHGSGVFFFPASS